MKDRIPLYPGRVKLTPVAGRENVYDMVRADEPTQEGSALNKANLLPDDVCDALFIPTDSSEVKDAFLSLASMYEWYVWKQYPIEYVPIHQYEDSTVTVNGTINYSDSVDASADGVVLSGQISSVVIQNSSSGESTAEVIRGKYCKKGSNKNVYYLPSDVVFTHRSGIGVRAKPIFIVGSQRSLENGKLVISKTPNLYPTYGEQDGYFYQGGYMLGNQSPDIGSFYGGDNADVSFEINVKLGYRPRAVLLFDSTGKVGSSSSGIFYLYGGLSLDGKPVYRNAIEITDTGFTARNFDDPDDTIWCASGTKYFMAWR